MKRLLLLVFTLTVLSLPIFAAAGPNVALASIYTPRTPGTMVAPDNHHWKIPAPPATEVRNGRTYYLRAREICTEGQTGSLAPQIGQASPAAIVFQSGVEVNCGAGQQAYAIAFIADTLDPVNGYFQFFNIQANGQGRFWVQTSQFSKTAYTCAMGCYVGGEYRATAPWHVQEVDLYSDHYGIITYEQCET